MSLQEIVVGSTGKKLVFCGCTQMGERLLPQSHRATRSHRAYKLRCLRVVAGALLLCKSGAWRSRRRISDWVHGPSRLWAFALDGLVQNHRSSWQGSECSGLLHLLKSREKIRDKKMYFTAQKRFMERLNYRIYWCPGHLCFIAPFLRNAQVRNINLFVKLLGHGEQAPER